MTPTTLPTLDTVLQRYLAVAPMALALERAHEVAFFAQVPSAGPTVDLGCGDGVFATIAFGHSPDVGLDVDLGEARHARQSGRYQSIVVGGGTDLPFQSQSVDAIVSNSVFEHIAELDALLAETFRVLRPTGRMHVTVPTDLYELYFFWTQVFTTTGLHSLACWYRRWVNGIFRHYHAYAPAEWIARLEAVGFRLVTTTPYLTRRVVAFNDFCYAFAVFGKLNRRIFGRWFAVPFLRRLLVPLLARLGGAIARGSSPVGGYVYLLVERPAQEEGE